MMGLGGIIGRAMGVQARFYQKYEQAQYKKIFRGDVGMIFCFFLAIL